MTMPTAPQKEAGNQPRQAEVIRNTAETQITVSVNLDGTGQARLATGIGFFDHMLDQLGRHGGFDLDVRAEGDLHVDGHHTVEDVGITVGETFRESEGVVIGWTAGQRASACSRRRCRRSGAGTRPAMGAF